MLLVRRVASHFHGYGLQVCVVALKKGQLQVLANAWDRDLGGRNLDLVLFEHFAK